MYFNGKVVARRDSATGNVYYFYSDHLGSMGVVTDALGQTIVNESDYYPYGGERVIASSLSDENYKSPAKNATQNPIWICSGLGTMDRAWAGS
ncbi:MAG: hypothetical protein NVS1B11_32200 [Terriglobales bacterium]